MLFEEHVLKQSQFGADTWSKVSFAKLQYRKGSDEAKRWKVRSAPSLVIIDNSKDKPKAVKTIRSGSPVTVRKAIEALIKKLSK